jgi:elongator complex protein 2
MALMQVDHLSIGANRQTASADWHQNGTLAFGADINVALWKSTVGTPGLCSNYLPW